MPEIIFLHNQESVRSDDFANGKQEVRLVLIVSVLCATRWLRRCSHGRCGHITECITPALQACIKLVFKFVETVEIPIMRSTSWGKARSPSFVFIRSYLLKMAHSALSLHRFIT